MLTDLIHWFPVFLTSFVVACVVANFNKTSRNSLFLNGSSF